ncbi:Short chain dehydrogenase [Bifidobacterium breve]|nr:Short chain dehydrogenase [Bifidobacterium breve]
MDLHLKNKVIIVTGGFKGIGKGVTLRLAEEGAIPVVLNRSDGAGDEFRQDIEQVTDSYDTYLIDLNNTDEIAPIVESVMKKYGHIDGVVNNAGRNDNLALETTSWRQFEESLHGNLTHYYELVHQCVPALKASKGSVVNIGSKTALTGQGKTSAYAAAKGAILGLTREWAAALARTRSGSMPSSWPKHGHRCTRNGSRRSATNRRSASSWRRSPTGFLSATA